MKNFQTDFIKLIILEHKGESIEERKVLELAPRGWLCLAAFISWRQSRLVERVTFLKVAGFLYWSLCLVIMFALATWGKMMACSLSLFQEGRQ